MLIALKVQCVFFNETTNHRPCRSDRGFVDSAYPCISSRVCLGRYCASPSRSAYSELAADSGRLSAFSFSRCDRFKFLSAVATADLRDGVLGLYFQSDPLSRHKPSAARGSLGRIVCFHSGPPPPLWHFRTSTVNRRLDQYV